MESAGTVNGPCSRRVDGALYKACASSRSRRVMPCCGSQSLPPAVSVQVDHVGCWAPAGVAASSAPAAASSAATTDA